MKKTYSLEELKIVEEIENDLKSAIKYGDLRDGNLDNCLKNIFRKYKK